MMGLNGFSLADIAAVATVGSLLIAAATAFVSAAVVVLSKRRDARLRAERVNDSKRFALAVVRAAAVEVESRLFDYQLVRNAFYLRPIIRKSSVNEIMRNAEVFSNAVLDPLVTTARHMRAVEALRKELNRAIEKELPKDRISAMFEDYRHVLEALVEVSRDLMIVLMDDLFGRHEVSKYPPLERGLFGRSPASRA